MGIGRGSSDRRARAGTAERSQPAAEGDEVRIRRDVWHLDEWDDTLLWYARAVTEMQRRPIADPTGWRFQAAIHAYIRARDPNADAADQLPSAAEQQRFWNQCQHGSWYFLPWHRIYLGFFERIVAATVEQLGGPAGWSLPYWNYSDRNNPNARTIPPAFRAERLPDGSPNRLWVEQRTPAANAGGVVAEDYETDVVDCLDEQVFIGTAFGAATGFGGPPTSFSHSGGAPGKLEMTPHGDMHVAVGGSFPLPEGYMSRFHTAGLDPLFWLHHANIDRLWTVWNRRNPANTNPTQPEWLNQPAFEFHDASGSAVSMTSAEVADSVASTFRYRYEEESDPLETPIETTTARAEEIPVPMEHMPEEMVGASESRTVLKGGLVTARVAMEPATGPAAAEAPVAPRRFHVNIENVRGWRPVPHLVYINIPDGANPADHPERLAGSLSMFGLPEASGEDPQQPGSGLTYSLDITRIVERLGDAWSPNDLRVTFVPKTAAGLEVPAAAGLETPAIEIGRISVYRSR